VEAGRGSPHGGAFLDITHRGPEYIKRKLPSMYEQFHKLADVDITKEPFEVGPTIHYVMGGIKVDPESEATTVPGLFAAGEVASGLHGANRLGGNSLSDLLVFGKRAGEGAAAFAKDRGDVTALDEGQIEAEKALLLRPFANHEAGRKENPYVFMEEIQAVMGDHVGLAREGSSLEEGLRGMQALRARVGDLGVADSRMYNPGWHACRDQVFMVEICEAMIRSAILREESRGGHWRLDHLDLDPEWGRHNLVSTLHDGEVRIEKRPIAAMPAELAGLIDDKPAVSKAALQAVGKA
jgi:succinate dehydrogenase / fumarate reductase flavoprotein subunit